MKTAIISGVTGQDGSYLAELLLDKGYFVVGLKRRTSLICTDRIDSIYSHKNFKMEYWDLNDSSSTYRLLLKYKPDEFYNLAAQSHVKVSFEVPEDTVNTIANGTLKILEAIRNILPSLVNEAINMVKESSIISVIGAADIMRRANVVSDYY